MPNNDNNQGTFPEQPERAVSSENRIPFAPDVVALRPHPFVLGQSLVSGSTMIVVAILNIGLFLFTMTQPKRLPPSEKASSFQAGYALAQLASDPVSLGVSLGALAGGVSIVRRENQTIAMLGSIVSCVPCQPVCFLAIPIGLWNVILLANYGHVIFAKKV